MLIYGLWRIETANGDRDAEKKNYKAVMGLEKQCQKKVPGCPWGKTG